MRPGAATIIGHDVIAIGPAGLEERVPALAALLAHEACHVERESRFQEDLYFEERTCMTVERNAGRALGSQEAARKAQWFLDRMHDERCHWWLDDYDRAACRRVPADRVTAQQAIAYFTEVALNTEYGGGEQSGVVRKWEEPVRVFVYGAPAATDIEEVKGVIDELSALTPTLEIKQVDSRAEANVVIYYGSRATIPAVLPGYVAGNDGFVWLWWSATGRLTRADIAIATEATPLARRHLLREELTQSLGLPADSSNYPASIFYEPWSVTTRYAAIDKEVIRILYHPRVEPGMTAEDVAALGLVPD